jgi:hypothetical protein
LVIGHPVTAPMWSMDPAGFYFMVICNLSKLKYLFYVQKSPKLYIVEARRVDSWRVQNPSSE